jgi:hypothetical protein
MNSQRHKWVVTVTRDIKNREGNLFQRHTVETGYYKTRNEARLIRHFLATFFPKCQLQIEKVSLDTQF